MRLSALAAALGLTTALSGCFVFFPVPAERPAPAAPAVEVQIDGRTLNVRRSAETFPANAPVNALTAEGISITAPEGVPVRGQGEPAAVVGGAALGEWDIAGRAVLAACGLTEEGAAEAGFAPARATYDADAAEALFPVALCPGLDGPAAAG